jgi:CheY-like chemotaxis protein
MATTGSTQQPTDVPKKLDCFHVLIIDDNEIDREITTHHLGAAWPFEREMATDTAADGREALDKMHGKHFTLIALDWKLPGMGGGEVLREMRRMGVRIPVVVLSGLHRHQIEDPLEQLGAAFLNKDEMNPDTFRAAIAESIRLLRFAKPA